MIKLFLPVLFPSWRFFSSIGPSPRIDIGFVAESNESPDEWVTYQVAQHFTLQRFTLRNIIIRLFHNPHWNEQLFINTCAERLFEGGDEFYIDEIAGRLLANIASNSIVVPANAKFMLFRLRAIYSEDAAANELGQVRDELFLQSSPYALTRRKVSNDI